MGKRGKLVVAGIVMAAVPVAWWGADELVEHRHAQAIEQAAQDVAQRHVDLVATATPDDLRDLWETSLTDDPGSLRTAGELLASEATERIEVLSVGTAYESDEPLDAARTYFDAHRAVDVRPSWSRRGSEPCPARSPRLGSGPSTCPWTRSRSTSCGAIRPPGHWRPWRPPMRSSRSGSGSVPPT